jgi:hypothetical protein
MDNEYWIEYDVYWVIELQDDVKMNFYEVDKFSHQDMFYNLVLKR